MNGCSSLGAREILEPGKSRRARARRTVCPCRTRRTNAPASEGSHYRSKPKSTVPSRLRASRSVCATHGDFRGALVGRYAETVKTAASRRSPKENASSRGLRSGNRGICRGGRRRVRREGDRRDQRRRGSGSQCRVHRRLCHERKWGRRFRIWFRESTRDSGDRC